MRWKGKSRASESACKKDRELEGRKARGKAEQTRVRKKGGVRGKNVLRPDGFPLQGEEGGGKSVKKAEGRKKRDESPQRGEMSRGLGQRTQTKKTANLIGGIHTKANVGGEGAGVTGSESGHLGRP